MMELVTRAEEQESLQAVDWFPLEGECRYLLLTIYLLNALKPGTKE
jgi:hypothetical protein